MKIQSLHPPIWCLMGEIPPKIRDCFGIKSSRSPELEDSSVSMVHLPNPQSSLEVVAAEAEAT